MIYGIKTFLKVGKAGNAAKSEHIILVFGDDHEDVLRQATNHSWQHFPDRWKAELAKFQFKTARELIKMGFTRAEIGNRIGQLID